MRIWILALFCLIAAIAIVSADKGNQGETPKRIVMRRNNKKDNQNNNANPRPRKIRKQIKKCPGKCVKKNACEGDRKGKRDCKGGKICCVSKASGATVKRFCTPLSPCSELSGECRKKKTGCQDDEKTFTSSKSIDYCDKKGCVCCVKECAAKNKCSKKGGFCVPKKYKCSGTVFKGKKYCRGNGKCKCCVLPEQCKPKRTCVKAGGTCVDRASGECEGEIKITNSKGKTYCKGDSCGCCLPVTVEDCAVTTKAICTRESGTCVASADDCVGDFKTRNDNGKKYCKSNTCGCCIPIIITDPITPAPLTPAPLTPAPLTPAPLTPAPLTPAPLTPAPLTPAPPTPAPPTPAPSPPVPSTSSPGIPVPSTPAPLIPAPSTPVPPAPAPSTPAPPTLAPSTPAPPTLAPSTPAPSTPTSSTPAPSTPAPSTPAPSTPAPSTLAPSTPAPLTPASSAQAPSTPSLSTSAPSTPAAPNSAPSTSDSNTPTSPAPASSTTTTASPSTTTVPSTTTCSITRPYCSDCGIANINVAEVRVVGGSNADSNEYPYQVLVVPSINGLTYQCGGSIIKKKWILTAAHCFFDEAGLKPSPTGITIGYGSSSLASGLSIVQSLRYIIHENYDNASYANDIALIELPSDLNYESDSTIQPICLAEDADISEGSKAVATGWGALAFQGSSTSELQEVGLDVISTTQCANLANLPPPDPNTVVCTLTANKDTCQGDSGGPLVVQVCPNRWVQIGIVSFGEKCAEPNSPGVYTKVPAFKTWIDTNTGSTNC